MIPQPYPQPQPTKRPSPWTSKPLVGVYGLAGGFLLGAAIFSGMPSPEPSAAPAPASTVTVTAPPEVAPSDDPTTEAPAPAGYEPHKSDWAVGVKVKEKQCFGSAGCSVTATIDPEYVGTEPLPDTGTIEVTYQISGDTSGPVVGTFTVTDKQASYDKETDLDTKSSSVKPAAKVTDVSYSEQ